MLDKEPKGPKCNIKSLSLSLSLSLSELWLASSCVGKVVEFCSVVNPNIDGSSIGNPGLAFKSFVRIVGSARIVSNEE